MKMFAIASAPFWLAALCAAAAPKPEPAPADSGDPVQTARRLGGLGEAEREKLLSGLSRDRFRLERELVKALDAAKDDAQRCAVAYLMGLYRLDGTARDLAKVIDLESKPPPRPADPAPPWGRYPAADALARIGLPAVPVLIEKIETSEGELPRELAAKAVHAILKGKLAEALLADARAAREDAVKWKRLDEALKLVRSLK